MPIKIDRVVGVYEEVRFLLEAGEYRCWVSVSEDGLRFYSHLTSSGAPDGRKPIHKTPEQLFAWIEKEGLNKEFKDRKGVRVKPAPKHERRANPFKRKSTT